MRFPGLVVLAALLAAAAGCSRSPEAVKARSLRAGKAYLEKKDNARAILEFSNAIRAVPSDPEAYYQLGLACLGSGDVEAAAQNFRRAIDRKPDFTAAQLQLAELESMSRNREAVESALRRAREILGRLPDDADALNIAGFAELRLGLQKEGRQDLERALRKFPAQLKTSVNLARARLLQQDIPGAEAVLKDAAARAPASTAPLTAMGEFYIVIGRFADAEQQFQQALAIEPANAVALYNLGQLQWRAGRMDDAEQTYRRLAAAPDRRYAQMHAAFLTATGKPDQAIAELERLTQASPDDRDLRTALVDAYLTAGRLPDAERVLAAALKHWPADPDALFQRSRARLAQRQYRQAEADIAQVLSVRPASSKAHYLRSKIQQAVGETTGRQTELTEALRLDATLAPARLDLARLLIDAKSARSALSLLAEAPAEQQATAAFVILRNWAWIALNDLDHAREGVARVLSVARLPEAVLQSGILKLREHDVNGAAAAAEEVLRSRPDAVQALDLLMQARPDLQKLEAYAAAVPQSVPVQRLLASFLARNRRTAEARRVLETARAANPSETAIYLDLADLDMAAGNLEAARETLTAILPSDMPDCAVRSKLAAIEMAAGNYDAALDHYRKIVGINSWDAAALNNLAYLLADFKLQPDEALKYAQKAKELTPESATTDDTLGWTYFRAGMYHAAIRPLERAVAAEPNARRKYHLAMAYLKLGEKAKGKQVLDAALRMDPSLPEAASARQILAEALN